MNNSLLHTVGRALVRFCLHPATLLVVITITGLVGYALASAAPEYAAQLDRASRLQPASAAALGDSIPGTEVLLEGHISAQNPVVYRSFVAYVYETYRDDSFFDNNNSQHWVEDKRETPPLLVTLADGDTRIGNSDYAFDTTATTVSEAEPTLTKGAVQSRGYVAGDQVLVFGTVVENQGQRTILADTLYAGTRATYIAEMKRLSTSSWPIAAPLLALCALSVWGLVWQVRRFIREAAAEQRATEEAAATQATQTNSGKRKRKSAAS